MQDQTQAQAPMQPALKYVQCNLSDATHVESITEHRFAIQDKGSIPYIQLEGQMACDVERIFSKSWAALGLLPVREVPYDRPLHHIFYTTVTKIANIEVIKLPSVMRLEGRRLQVTIQDDYE